MPTFEKNRFLGIAFLVLGLLKIVGFLIIFTGAERLFQQNKNIIVLSPLNSLTIFNFIIGISVLIGGYAFLNVKPWIRIYGLIISVVLFFDYPLGTFLGICGIWFLTSNECKDFYEEPEKVKQADLSISNI